MNKRKKNNEKEELVAIPPLYTCIYCKRYFKWLFLLRVHIIIGGTDLLPLEKIEAYYTTI